MKLYVIESLKWSNTANYDGTVYWGWNNNGYTTDMHQAGIYTQEQVENNREYYDDGTSTKAVELTVENMNETVLGMVQAHYYHKLRDEEEIEESIKRLEQQLSSLKKARVAVKENVAAQRFKVNQQLILRGEEPIK